MIPQGCVNIAVPLVFFMCWMRGAKSETNRLVEEEIIFNRSAEYYIHFGGILFLPNSVLIANLL